MDNNYFIFGDDEYAIKKQINSIVSKISLEYDEVKIDMAEANIGTLLEEIKTIPFLTPVKLILVSNVDLIKDSSEYYKEFLEIVSNPISNIYTIFLSNSKEKTDCKIFEDLNKYTTSYIFKNDGSSLDKILVDVLKTEGFQMSKDTVNAFLSRVSTAEALYQEIEKLMIYKMKEKLITIKDVELLVSDSLDTNVFDLITAVVEGKKKAAIQIYRNLQVFNIVPTYLLGLLISKFQEIVNVKTLVDSGYSQELIASAFNVKSGRAYYMIKNCNLMNISIVKEKLEYLSNLEADIKMGKQDQTLGVELFLLL